MRKKFTTEPLRSGCEEVARVKEGELENGKDDRRIQEVMRYKWRDGVKRRRKGRGGGGGGGG